MLCEYLKSRWVFDFVWRIFRYFCAPNILFLDSIIFFKKNIGGFNPFKYPSYKHHQVLQHHQHHQHLQHPYIYSRIWLFQIRTAALGTEAESICLFRTLLNFKFQQNIIPLWVFFLLLFSPQFEFYHNEFFFFQFCQKFDF